MKKILAPILPCLLLLTGCKKSEQALTLNANRQITLTLDDRYLEKIYPADESDQSNSYSFCNSAPNCRAGYGAGYQLENDEEIYFRLGQLSSSQLPVSFEAFKSLFTPGVKTFDSLLVWGQQSSNCVEVFYAEGTGKRWGSTHIKSNSTAGSMVTRTVNQPGSSFVIESMKEITENNVPVGVKIKGRFNCILYEEDGIRQKMVKDATFIAQVMKW